ncbi:unnamed protein product [Choristocarpus tenellus]
MNMPRRLVASVAGQAIGLICGGGLVMLAISPNLVSSSFSPVKEGDVGVSSRELNGVQTLPAIYPKPTPTDGTYPQASSFALDLKRKDFSPRNAHYMAHLSRVAYADKSQASKRCSDLGLESFHWFTKKSNAEKGLDHDTQSFVASNGQFTVVVFRGTTSLSDWATNTLVWRIETPYGSVHRGFNAAVDTVWAEMLPVIKRIHKEDPSKPIYVCGHSLGAALASIATARLELDENIEIANLYTIGSPRVFQKDFAEKFDEVLKKKTFRAVNNNDIVTDLPFDNNVINTNLFNFRHIGNLIYITRRGNIGGRGWWDGIAGRFQALLGGTISDGKADHSAINYEEVFRREAVKAEKGLLVQVAGKVASTVMEVSNLF